MDGLTRTGWQLLLSGYILSERKEGFTRGELMKISGLLSWGSVYHDALIVLVQRGYFRVDCRATIKTHFYSITPLGFDVVRKSITSLDYFQYS